jgi:hypothetical protein
VPASQHSQASRQPAGDVHSVAVREPVDPQGDVVLVDGQPLHEPRLPHDHRMDAPALGTIPAGGVDGDGGIAREPAPCAVAVQRGRRGVEGPRSR